MYNRSYIEQFNPDVIKDLSKLHKEIEEEKKRLELVKVRIEERREDVSDESDC